MLIISNSPSLSYSLPLLFLLFIDNFSLSVTFFEFSSWHSSIYNLFSVPIKRFSLPPCSWVATSVPRRSVRRCRGWWDNRGRPLQLLLPPPPLLPLPLLPVPPNKWSCNKEKKNLWFLIPFLLASYSSILVNINLHHLRERLESLNERVNKCVCGLMFEKEVEVLVKKKQVKTLFLCSLFAKPHYEFSFGIYNGSQWCIIDIE